MERHRKPHCCFVRLSLFILYNLATFLLGAQQGFGNNPRDRIALPAYDEIDLVFFYTAYALQYNEDHEQADWVAWRLTKEMVNTRIAKRSDRFHADPAIPSGSATLEDYRGSGFDRGHLIPAADLRFSEQAMLDSFLLSNISPKRATFNRGIWRRLEAVVRSWADRLEEIFIVTGPILDKSDFQRIGPNMVSVPEYFYKAILYWHGDVAHCIGFILPNQKGEAPLASFAFSIDYLEKRSGLDFFPSLPDDLESLSESFFDLTVWPQNSIMFTLIELKQEQARP